jgi:hypothetical protein
MAQISSGSTSKAAAPPPKKGRYPLISGFDTFLKCHDRPELSVQVFLATLPNGIIVGRGCSFGVWTTSAISNREKGPSGPFFISVQVILQMPGDPLIHLTSRFEQRLMTACYAATHREFLPSYGSEFSKLCKPMIPLGMHPSISYAQEMSFDRIKPHPVKSATPMLKEHRAQGN